MAWKKYELEVVTPMFCAGADQRQAEIRVPSIRGQVRWWFRALGGTREKEKFLFGGVHDAARASAVRMRLVQPVRSAVAKNLNDVVPGGNMNHPVSYLLWPLRPTGGSDQKRGCIEPGTRFSLQTQVDPAIPDTLRMQFDAALHLWMLLGSLGTRSRRGAGSLQPAAKGGDFPWETASLEEWEGAVCSEFDNAPAAEVRVFQVDEPQPTWMEALSSLGRWLKKWRAGSTRSVPNPLRWGKSDHDVACGQSQLGVVYRPVLGLPLTQRFSGPSRGGASLVVETLLSDAKRWASPLHLKVVKVTEGHVPVAVFFPSLAIPEGEPVRLRPQRGGRIQDKAVSWDLLNVMLRKEGQYPVQIYPEPV